MPRSFLAVSFASLLAAALCMSADAASAQVAPTGTTYRPAFNIAAGIDIPTGTAGDLHSSGWKIQAGADWTSPANPFGLRADLSYGSMASKQIVGATTVSPNDLHMFSITGDGVWEKRPTAGSASRSTPYLLAGVGLYHASVTPGSRADNSSITNFGLNFGGGIRYLLAGFSAFAELRLHDVFSGARDSNGNKVSAYYLPIVVGIRFGAR